MLSLKEAKREICLGVTPEQADIYNGHLAKQGVKRNLTFEWAWGLFPSLREHKYPSSEGYVRSVLEGAGWIYQSTLVEGGLGFRRPETHTSTPWEGGVCTPDTLGDWCCKHLPLELGRQIATRYLQTNNQLQFSSFNLNCLVKEIKIPLPFWWVGGVELAFAHKGWAINKQECDAGFEYCLKPG